MENMKCGAILIFINQKLKKLFYWWGKQVQKYPFSVILASLLLCIGLGYMLVFYEQSKEQDQLYLPLNSEAFDHLNYIKDIFKTQPRPQVVFLSSKQDSNILTKQIFQSIYEFHQGLMEVSADGLKYKDLCYKLDEENDCDFQGHLLEFFEVERGQFDIDRVSDDQQLIQLLNSGRGQPEFYPEGTQQYISVDYTFGQTTPKHVTTYSDNTNNLKEAKALILSYQLGNKKDTSLYFEYQEKLEEYTRYFTKNNKHLEFFIYTHSAVQRQSQQIINQDVYLFYIGASLVVIWCFIVLGNLELTKSRMSMGIVGIFTVMIAFLQALGFGTLVGLKGNPFVGLLPFLLIGIGVDDMFVIVDSISRVPPTTPRDQKLAAVLKLAGPSITLTSITNVFSFLMGSYTTIPALRSFCYFAAMGMFFDFLNQITIFCAVLSLDIRRSQKGLGDFVGLCFCKPDSKICCKGKYINDELGHPKKSLIKKFMGKCVGPVLVKFPVNLIILILICGLLGVSVYGILNLKFHFDYQDLIPEDSYIEQVIHFRDQFFDRQPRNIRYYTIKTEFSSQQTQLKLIELNQNISQCKGCDQIWIIEDSTNSWYEAFRGWVFTNECSVDGVKVSLTSSSVIPEQYFYQCLNQWLSTNSGSKFENKVLFDSSHQKLKGAFISVLVSNQEDTEDKVQIMKDLRDIAQKGPGTTFPYDSRMSEAQKAVLFLKEFSISLGLSGACIFILVLIILGDILVALYVFLVIAVLVITLLGFLHLSNLPFNMITLVNVIVSLGISVDYSAHIAYSLINQKNLGRKFRILDTLDEVGSSVMNAAISTFLAILPMLYSKIFFYQIYFIQWAQLVLFGVLYGLILLPIAFYFFGDTNCVSTIIRKLSGSYNKNLFQMDIPDQSTARVVPQIQEIPQEKGQDNFGFIPTSQNVGPDQDGEIEEEHLEFINNQG